MSEADLFDAPFGAEPEIRGSRYVRPWPVRERKRRDLDADKAKRAAVLARLPSPDFAASWPYSSRVALSIISELCERFGSCDWSYDRLADAAGYCRETMIAAVGDLVGRGVFVKRTRPVDGEMNLTNRLILKADGPLFAAAARWLRKWGRWLWAAAKPASKTSFHPSGINRDKTISFLKRLALWRALEDAKPQPGDIVCWADWCRPPELPDLCPASGGLG